MKQKELVPKRRFEGLMDEWNSKKMKELASFSKGRGYSKGDLVSYGNPIILYGHLYTNYQSYIQSVKTYATRKENSVISEGNEVIVPSSGETAEDIARASAVGKSGIILAGDLNIIKPSPILDSLFLGLNISNSSVNKELIMRVQGSSVVHLYNSDIKEVNLSYPSMKEQQKIGNFFKHLDQMITLEQRKLGKIKALKSAYLAEMFPAEGERVPKRRFAGFTDEWQKRQFKDILKTNSTKNNFTSLNSKGNYKVIQQGDNSVVGYATGDPFEKYKEVVLFGDHTVSLYNPDAPFFVATDGLKILSADGFTGDFLYILLGKYKPEPQGYKRHFTILVNEYCMITKNKEEQEAIGEFFKKIDGFITNQQQKLNKLKAMKQAYLQEMFV